MNVPGRRVAWSSFDKNIVHINQAIKRTPITSLLPGSPCKPTIPGDPGCPFDPCNPGWPGMPGKPLMPLGPKGKNILINNLNEQTVEDKCTAQENRVKSFLQS